MTSNVEGTVSINGKIYSINKLKKSLDTHEEEVEIENIISNDVVIPNDNIVTVLHSGKYQIILGELPQNKTGKIKIRVASKFSLKRTEYIPAELLMDEHKVRNWGRKYG